MPKLSFIKPPIRISGDRITLKRYVPEDAESLYEAARESSELVYPFLDWCHPDYQLEESHKWIAQVYQKWLKGEWFDFAIFDNESKKFLGGCGLNDIRTPQLTANLGYWVRSSATRQGVATESTRLLAQYAFEHLNIQRVEILVAENNLASIQVAQKSGAVLEGTLRNRLFLHGTPTDAVLYSLLPEDFG